MIAKHLIPALAAIGSVAGEYSPRAPYGATMANSDAV